MKDLVEFVARSLAERPDRVETRTVEEGRLELVVERSDLGRIIGRRGRTAQALRALLSAMAEEGAEPELEITAHGEADAE